MQKEETDFIEIRPHCDPALNEFVCQIIILLFESQSGCREPLVFALKTQKKKKKMYEMINVGNSMILPVFLKIDYL